jgi:competence protein ComEA
MRLSKCLYLVAVWPFLGWAMDINHASEADLDSLKGVGPATTQRLLAERSKRPFTDWADLVARVKGLRAPTARKLSDQGLTVNGVQLERLPGG